MEICKQFSIDLDSTKQRNPTVDQDLGPGLGLGLGLIDLGKVMVRNSVRFSVEVRITIRFRASLEFVGFLCFNSILLLPCSLS